MSIPALACLEQYANSVTLIGKKEFLPLLHQIFPMFTTLEFSKYDFSGLRGIKGFCQKNPALREAAYVTMTPSFSSALMGWCLKGTRTIGYQGNLRSWLLSEALPPYRGHHRSDEYLHLMRSITAESQAHKRDFARGFTASPPPSNLNSGEYIVINVNSEACSRKLPLEQWQKLLPKLQYQLVFIGSLKEHSHVAQTIASCSLRNSLNLAGQTNIVDLGKVLAHAKCLISNDSGPAHLATLLRCPTAVFFGAGDERNTRPLSSGADVVVIREQLECSPCLKNQCPLKTLECLHSIDMDRVYSSIRSLLT